VTDELRASNADREAVVQRLNTAFSEGRLDLAELDERVAKAYAAKTLGDLRGLTIDLPAGSASRPGLKPAPADQGPPQPPATAQNLKQAALELAHSRINAKLERDRQRVARRRQRYEMAHLRGYGGSVAAWASVSLICFTVWLVAGLTGSWAVPWFLWVAGPWGAVLLMRYLSGHSSR